MGYHIALVPYLSADGKEEYLPEIVKDGGTGSWRDAKKELRKFFLNRAAALRTISEKDYNKGN